ncbi:hypothetical protein K505DRAFT_353938 [Melanomma pulvis-pyrius CBS 109.77]|uniref:DUF7587 domain-containing protein n=1 Tax=Melanomma pulvis-pyrius CBS 109.77 TaxID=1314802 RepID=A0A6A6WU53_9PLEO|nr:hypothetical protein K505DRAFT_353938 [Melanomma pulvis-pyrius CBS 109.77]
MALESLEDQLTSLNLSPDEYLAYNPSKDRPWLLQKFDNIPRYLFRVYTPRSCGITDTSWTKSKNSRYGNQASRHDIFARTDDKAVAAMLHRHLMWQKGDDNFVSWTSSLLFALVYIFHLHASLRDGSEFMDIHLCIIDTTRFARGVFLRGLDLIQAYRVVDSNLAQTEELRTRKHGGRYYFGEYLSQGALRIEGKCDIVSASALIDQGLFDLQPAFKEFTQWPKAFAPPWVYPVLKLRDEIRHKICSSSITQLFGSRWRLPMAANLIASLPYREEDSDILNFFKGTGFTGSLLFCHDLTDANQCRWRQELMLQFEDENHGL